MPTPRSSRRELGARGEKMNEAKVEVHREDPDVTRGSVAAAGRARGKERRRHRHTGSGAGAAGHRAIGRPAAGEERQGAASGTWHLLAAAAGAGARRIGIAQLGPWFPGCRKPAHGKVVWPGLTRVFVPPPGISADTEVRPSLAPDSGRGGCQSSTGGEGLLTMHEHGTSWGRCRPKRACLPIAADGLIRVLVAALLHKSSAPHACPARSAAGRVFGVWVC